ncbi:MAG: NTP transferase domain-containing protein [Oscillospiraceae bacterium]|jgi:bifunctional UDP-N-acetylglucosamine pyrophosphorylase/glucosamine-1-phosphate N-acetyltransferase/UDP-N-acetylglucosamine pyrophosphorylase|nr:NTP transferase domain-containing protein [Oscillospiraceae bacterium]
MPNKTEAIVLAAGRGKRLDGAGADLPKVLRQAAGRPLLRYVTDGLGFLGQSAIILVVGYKAEAVVSAFPGYSYAVQEQQLGTANAAACGLACVSPDTEHVLVCCGDMPLISENTYRSLLLRHTDSGADATVLACACARPLPYGRVILAPDGGFVKIVEDKDASEEEKRVTALNTGLYVFRKSALEQALGQITSNNAQNEFYLTDAPAIIAVRGGRVSALCMRIETEITGVNTPEDLAFVEAELMKHRRS